MSDDTNQNTTNTVVVDAGIFDTMITDGSGCCSFRRDDNFGAHEELWVGRELRGLWRTLIYFPLIHSRIWMASLLHVHRRPHRFDRW